MAKHIINALGILIELYIPNVLFKKLGKKTDSKVLSFVLFFLAFFIQFVGNYIFLSKSNYVMIFTFFSIFILSLIYKLEIKVRLYSCLFVFVTGALSEFAIAYISTMIFNADTKFTQSNKYLLLFCTLSSKFLQYAILRIIKINNKTNKFPFAIYYDVVPLPLATLPVLLLLFDCCYRISDQAIQITALVSSILLIFANIFVFNLIEKHTDYLNTKRQLNFTKKHIDYQVKHYKELYNHQFEIRKYRHDTKNRLTGLLALLEDNCYEDAISSLKKELNLMNETSENVFNSNNPILDAILLSKIKTANTFNIDIKPTVIINQPIYVDAIDLSILIGNALDNAIEAAKLIPNTVITIKIISLVEQITIEITNPVKENVDTHRLKSNKANIYLHGLGIESMQSISSKYDGEIYFSCKECIFTTDIILANAKPQ